MIASMHIENFKCFEDFDIELGPFNVLIGPNDSGKTAFLEAIRILSGVGPSKKMPADGFRLTPETPLIPHYVWRQQEAIAIRISASGDTRDNCRRYVHHEFTCDDKTNELQSQIVLREGAPENLKAGLTKSPKLAEQWFDEVIGKVVYYQLDPASLKKDSDIVRKGSAMSTNGDGLPTYLEELLREDREAFSVMEKQLYAAFPQYEGFTLGKKKAMNTLTFRTTQGTGLSARDVSDGVVLYLAYLAIAYQPSPPQIVLAEEPENGVHHANLKCIVQALRHLAEDKQVQVIMTTHSPYLLDCVEPEEVRVFHKDEEGAAHAARLSDHPEVGNLKDLFMTGEIWTEFDEADIVENGGGEK